MRTVGIGRRGNVCHVGLVVVLLFLFELWAAGVVGGRVRAAADDELSSVRCRTGRSGSGGARCRNRRPNVAARSLCLNRRQSSTVVDASPPLCSVGRSGSGAGATRTGSGTRTAEPEPAAPGRIVGVMLAVQNRARRSAHRRLRPPSPLALARASACGSGIHLP